MANYSGDLKSIKKNIRMTEEMEKQVESFPGVDFSDKLRNLIDYSINQMPYLNQQIMQLNQEILRLQEERQQLIQDVQVLRNCQDMFKVIYQEMDKLQGIYNHEVQHRQNERISLMIEKSGFVPTVAVVEKIRILNDMTGKEYQLVDICRAYKESIYLENNPVANLVQDIYREFQKQELQRQVPDMEEIQCID